MLDSLISIGKIIQTMMTPMQSSSIRNGNDGPCSNKAGKKRETELHSKVSVTSQFLDKLENSYNQLPTITLNVFEHYIGRYIWLVDRQTKLISHLIQVDQVNASEDPEAPGHTIYPITSVARVTEPVYSNDDLYLIKKPNYPTRAIW